jgi:hypothetical protein
MPALVAGIHVFASRKEDVDGRHKAGRDGGGKAKAVADQFDDIAAFRIGLQ